ncbi:MAG: NifB/NifX family molybdenum-iron cluster-binding protein [Chloroflexi bacterium]|nr:NifB/NifX family molybdenum-iron cluster-binding protein [Chloroflexota bacterium]
MRIVVTSNGRDLDAPASPVFGRCPVYVFVDTETMQCEAVDNPAMSAAGGAGIQAAQFIVEQGAQAVLSGNMGPNAFNVFQAANVPVYLISGGTVQEAVEAYKAGRLPSTADANVQAHAGMGMGRGMGMGMGRGRGRGMGWGMTPPAASSAPTAPRERGREEEIAELGRAAGELRQQLAEIMERIEKLGKES